MAEDPIIDAYKKQEEMGQRYKEMKARKSDPQFLEKGMKKNPPPAGPYKHNSPAKPL